LVPSVAAVLANCPQATLNPETDEPFSTNVILRVFRTKCYDIEPEHPWNYDHPKQKTTLSPEFVLARATWADAMLAFNHHAGWYFRHIVWVDPCYTIIPGRPKTIHDQMVSSFGKAKRWGSADARNEPKNLRSSPYTNKTTQWGDVKLWWFIVLARGRVHVEVMGRDWIQHGAGQAKLVERLPKILKKMLGHSETLPDTVFSDRGPGFYHPSRGTINPYYAEALTKFGFSPWAGDHALWQPGDIPDLLLHETAVSWVRKFLRQHPVKLGENMDRNIGRVEEKLLEAVDHINTHYEVEDCNTHQAKQTKQDQPSQQTKADYQQTSSLLSPPSILLLPPSSLLSPPSSLLPPLSSPPPSPADNLQPVFDRTCSTYHRGPMPRFAQKVEGAERCRGR